ncbi:extended synaptotagmin-3-like [Pundamilia nyererei]|uniref:Extended synaptotagmin-3-like n=1 Tax=Pundamilia nyererei TaxID=303518 RepID=A0A9Y6M9D3_9CICH|nr:PREDICTED: extended synaptotagmin-3-like [Pundamilia nyererei]
MAVLEKAWPFIGVYMEKLLREKIQPSIRSSNPALKAFTFTKIHFGYKPLKITGIRAYTHEVEHREVILDMNISYDGDVDISTDVSLAITTRVKGLKLQGMLRVILEPLIGQAPLVGGVTFFFIRRPVSGQRLSHSLIMTSGALYSLSEETILDAIASIMVLPNRMCIPLIDKVKGDQMRFPLPHGVVRVHLLEARDLVAKNTHVMNLMKAKSDRYATLRVGSTHFKSKTVKENLFPKWNEVCEFIVHEAPGQELELELCNEGADKDDCLGRYNLDFGEVKREKQMDQWFPVDRALHGEVHLKLQRFSLQTDTSLLKQEAYSSLSTDNFACAVLAVYLHSATDLPLTKRTTCPNCFVEMSIDDDVKKSEVAYASKDPVWEKGFTFFVHNVSAQELIVQVKEPEKKNLVGVLSLPLSHLLRTSNLTLDQRFMLERSGANSQIKLRATLRILNLEEPPSQTIFSPPPQGKQQQARKSGYSSVSNPSNAPPSSHTASSNNIPAASTPNLEGASPSKDYLAQGCGSSQAPENRKQLSSSINLRRFDSHSLLLENVIDSSRFDLSDGASYPEAIRNHLGSFGEIALSVRYVAMRNKLMVFVNNCRNLFPCSENGTDSYVRLYLLPVQSLKHRKRTGVKKRAINPIFKEKFQFDVTLREAQTRKLCVSVKSNKMLVSRERKGIGLVCYATSG